jgi:hypothetical protein
LTPASAAHPALAAAEFATGAFALSPIFVASGLSVLEPPDIV